MDNWVIFANYVYLPVVLESSYILNLHKTSLNDLAMDCFVPFRTVIVGWHWLIHTVGYHAEVELIDWTILSVFIWILYFILFY